MKLVPNSLLITGSHAQTIIKRKYSLQRNTSALLFIFLPTQQMHIRLGLHDMDVKTNYIISTLTG